MREVRKGIKEQSIHLGPLSSLEPRVPPSSSLLLNVYYSRTLGNHVSLHYVLLLLICHSPNSSHLYCGKQYISYQTFPNQSSLWLGSTLSTQQMRLLEETSPLLINWQTSNFTHCLCSGVETKPK